jgi:hypothetical protein
VTRAFNMVAAALAAATVIGLVLLWPGDVESQVAQGIAVDSHQATVDRVEERFCAGFATQRGHDRERSRDRQANRAPAERGQL